MLGIGIVNIFLGIVYGITSLLMLRFLHHSMNATPEEYSIIFSKKGLVLSLFYLIGFTTATVSYQNFFADFSTDLLWWRLGLITCVAYITLRLGNLAKQVRHVISPKIKVDIHGD
jgi:hypothetical protein